MDANTLRRKQRAGDDLAQLADDVERWLNMHLTSQLRDRLTTSGRTELVRIQNQLAMYVDEWRRS